ncbi:MAG: class I SAM-dependent methyltransferase [bacterium]|nr:class I SAM-dependent methyltransferase [bacterium]
MTTTRIHAGSPVTVEHVPCPSCGSDDYVAIAAGPDYDHHCCGDQIFTLAQCKKCGFAYLNPRPTTDMLPRIYEAEDYICYDFDQKGNSFVQNWRVGAETRRIKKALEHVTRPIPDLRVCDIGPGDGTTLVAFGQMGVKTENLYGVDIDQSIIDKLESKGLRGILSRAEDLNPTEHPEARNFDVVLMLQVIEHVADPRRVMEVSHEMLRPGGIIWMETPNLAGWDRPFFRKRAWGGYHFPRHWVLFTPRTMRRMLEEVGFEFVGIWSMSATFVWIWSINHVLQDRGWTRLANFFSFNNPLVAAFFLIFDLIPRSLNKASNMRVIARKK